jgi:hypothetical protein
MAKVIKYIVKIPVWLDDKTDLRVGQIISKEVYDNLGVMACRVDVITDAIDDSIIDAVLAEHPEYILIEREVPQSEKLEETETVEPEKEELPTDSASKRDVVRGRSSK